MKIWGKRKDADETVKKPNRTYRRLIIAGSIISLIAIIIRGLGRLVILYALTQSNRLPPLTNIFFYIATLIFIESFFLIAIFIYGLKLKIEDSDRINKFSKKILLLFLILLVVSTLIPTLFQKELINSLTPLVSNLVSMYSYPIQVPNFVTLIISILYYVVALGYLLIVLGALSGLAKSKNQSLFDYLYKHKKAVIIGIISIFVIIAVTILLINYKVSTDNAMALQQLNQKISNYGTNIRYLLSNKSSFVNTTNIGEYENVSLGSNNQSSIGDILPLANLNYAQINNFTNALNNYDWYVSSPIIRGILINELFVYGLPVINPYQTNKTDIFFPQHYQLLVPVQASNLESLYELKGVGSFIFLNGVSLAKLSGQNAFSIINPYNGPNISTTGFTISMIPVSGLFFSNTGLTSILNKSNFYDDISLSQLGNGWISLVFAIDDSYGKVINATVMRNLFYSIAIQDYFGYLNSEILYNTTISPNIDFVGYQNNTLIINLGNLNLSNPKVKLYIDGNATNYTRYWNFLLIKNKHLGIGWHEISVTINNLTVSQNIYNSPALVTNQSLNTSGYLSFYIYNPYQSNLTIYNITVVRGLTQKLNLSPTLSNIILETNSTNHPNLLFYNATYYKFNFYKEQFYSRCPNNLTNCSAIVGNYTPYKIHNSSLVLAPKDYVVFRYKMSQQQNISIMSLYYFTVKYNTNYGYGAGVLPVKAV